MTLKNASFIFLQFFKRISKTNRKTQEERKMKIAVAGTGYVGLSIATLLAQHNEVTIMVS